MRKHFKVLISGNIQRQGFRFYAVKKAYEIGVTGHVGWDESEALLIHIEGTQSQLEKYLAWCKVGPPGAKVISLISEELPLENFTSFEMR